MKYERQVHGFIVNARGRNKHIRLAEIIKDCDILGIHVITPVDIMVISDTLNGAKGTRNIVKSKGFRVSEVTDVFIPITSKGI